MEITFHGAARTVTGSQHLVSLNGARFLLDCGLYQGKRKESYYRNKHFVYDPKDVRAVVLSHAHIDHSGNLPNLVKRGFAGPIHTTSASRDLSAFMLRDSGAIHESDAAFVSRRAARRGEPPVEPLYTMADAEVALQQFTDERYGQPFEVAPGVAATFYDAGHILGSAIMVLDLEEKGRRLRLCFSGDVGRKDIPILRDPTVVQDIDFLILESTYGNRLHPSPAEARDRLRETARRAIERGGKIIIPSFAVGRAQDLIYAFHQMMDAGEIARIPVYVDSPLAVNISSVFRRHTDMYDAQTRQFMQDDHHAGALQFDQLHYVKSVDESKSLNDKRGPMVIISASGMAESGRVLHHLRNNVHDPAATVLIVSWQAPHTLGRRLVERQPRVKIFGEEYELKAQVEVINGYSAHADRNGLLEYAAALKPRLKRIFLVHGEPEPAFALADGLKQLGFDDVYVPQLHETVEV